MKILLPVFSLFLLSLTCYSQGSTSDSTFLPAEVISDSTFRPTKAGRRILSDVGDGVLNARERSGNSEVYGTRTFRNCSELRNFDTPRSGVQYWLSEKGKQGWFEYNSTDFTTVDDGFLNIVATNGKRFKRVIDATGKMTLSDTAQFLIMSKLDIKEVIFDNYTWIKKSGNKPSNGGTIVNVGSNAYFERDFKGNAKAEWFKGVSWDKVFKTCSDLGVGIDLVKGTTYPVSLLTALKGGIRINGNGATIDNRSNLVSTDANGGVGDTFVIDNATDQRYNVSEITYSGNNNGITTIVIAGVDPDIQIGNVLKIYSSDLVVKPVTDGVQSMAEFISPISVVTSNGVTTIKVQGPLFYTYTTNIKIAILLQDKVSFKDLTFSSGPGNIGSALVIKNCVNPEIKDCVFKNASRPPVTVWGNYSPVIDNVSVHFVEDVIAGIGRANSVGYGVNAAANQNLTLTNSSFNGLRHGYTTGGNDGGTNDILTFKGEERGAKIAMNSFKNSQIPCDTHTPGNFIEFSDNRIDNCAIGVQNRSQNTIIRNNTIINCGIGVFSYNDMVNGTIIDGNTIFEYYQYGIVVNKNASNTIGNVEITRNRVKTTKTGTQAYRLFSVNAKSEGNLFEFTPSSSNPIFSLVLGSFRGNNDELIVKNSAFTPIIYQEQGAMDVRISDFKLSTSSPVSKFINGFSTGGASTFRIRGLNFVESDPSFFSPLVQNLSNFGTDGSFSTYSVSGITNDFKKITIKYPESTSSLLNTYLVGRNSDFVLSFTGALTADLDLTSYALYTGKMGNDVRMTLVNNTTGGFNIIAPSLGQGHTATARTLSSKQRIELQCVDGVWGYIQK